MLFLLLTVMMLTSRMAMTVLVKMQDAGEDNYVF